jgi:hypothetical protein
MIIEGLIHQEDTTIYTNTQHLNPEPQNTCGKSNRTKERNKQVNNKYLRCQYATLNNG